MLARALQQSEDEVSVEIKIYKVSLLCTRFANRLFFVLSAFIS